MKLDEYHEAEKLDEGFWRISEKDFVNLYLLEGTEKALLVDLGCGAGDLPAAVRKLTDKPVIAAVTHGHPDHIGACGQFGEYWADEREAEDIRNGVFNRSAPADMCARAGMTYNPASAKPCTILPISDDTVFDLGNRKIVTEKLPGHSAGSRIFIDHENRIIISGDACNPYMFLQLPGCLTIEEWLGEAPKLLKYLDRGYSSWYGHGDGRQSREQVEQIIRYGEEILQMNRAGKLKESGMYPAETLPRVYYRIDGIAVS